MTDQKVRTHLNKYFEDQVQLDKEETLAALAVWEDAVEKIISNVKSKDPDRFDLGLFASGSFYERAKVKKPNEFDLMLEIKNLELGQWDPYDSDDEISQDPPLGYTTVMLDEGEEERWKGGACIGKGNLLNATNVKAKFTEHVKVVIKECQTEKEFKELLISAKSRGPAVTLTVTHEKNTYSVDLTLAIKDKTWPEDADEWVTRQREGWPKSELVDKIVKGGCHLVAKKAKRRSGRAIVDDDFMWRYSFSLAEKELFRQGSSGEEGTCRHMLLRILKSLRQDHKMTPLTSYHLKTIVFYECEKYPNHDQWLTSKLAERFQSAMMRLLRCLQQERCPHYFIKGVDLFDSDSFNKSRYEFLIDIVKKLLTHPLEHITV